MVYALRARGVGSRVSVDEEGPYITLTLVSQTNADMG